MSIKAEDVAFAWAAAPRTYLLEPTGLESDPDMPGYYRRGVIGWAMTREGEICPITVEGVEPLKRRVLFDKGPIDSFEDNYPSVASFLRENPPGSER